MSNSDLISVIVPVYNAEEYLDKCIGSIVNQTYKNLEIILVDDESPDNSPAICDEWAKKDSRIKVIHKKNDGAANARNSGIDVFCGDYVMFADCDDYLQADMVEYLYKLIREHNADISRCGFYLCYENGHKESASKDYAVQELSEKEIICDLLTGGHLAGVIWNKLYKRDLVKSHRYNKIDNCAEDIMFNYRIYRGKPKTVFCNEPKYNYLIRDNSMTNQKFSYGAFDIIRAKKMAYEDFKNDEVIAPYATKGYINSAFIVLSGCITNHAFPKERDELISFIRSHKKDVLFSSMYSWRDKIKTLILSISPVLYGKLLLRSNSL